MKLNYGDTFDRAKFLEHVEDFAPDMPVERAMAWLESFILAGWFVMEGIQPDGTWLYRYVHPHERPPFVVLEVRKGIA